MSNESPFNTLRHYGTGTVEALGGAAVLIGGAVLLREGINSFERVFWPHRLIERIDEQLNKQLIPIKEHHDE